ncbi:MAG: hypothetical protein LBC64_00605 [Fibromonadaceae bacterium]|jgi:hypothetical protein|nr:hypothetical protein [Fibromonadaceae bacterium]
MKTLKNIFTRRFKKPIYSTFTKGLLYLFLVCVLASIAGCSCDDTEAKLPSYANKSGEKVKIIAISERTGNNYEKTIADGDTLHYTEEGWYVPKNIGCGSSISFGNCYGPIRMELHFINEPKKCLIFDGLIKNDGIDMRSWDSYEKGNNVDGWAAFEYVYTITPAHRAIAKEEDCQSSTDE